MNTAEKNPVVNTFLQKTYGRIIKLFPCVKIEYQYREKSLTHFVRVTPKETYDSAAFIYIIGDLYDEWVNISGENEEDFCVITEGSLARLDNPVLIHEPESLKVKVTIPWLNISEEAKAEVIARENFYSWHNPRTDLFNSSTTTESNRQFAMAA